MTSRHSTGAAGPTPKWGSERHNFCKPCLQLLHASQLRQSLINFCDWIHESHLECWVRFGSCLRSGHPDDKFITFYILILVHNSGCLEHTGIVGIGRLARSGKLRISFIFFSLIQTKVKLWLPTYSVIADFIEDLRAFFLGAIRIGRP